MKTIINTQQSVQPCDFLNIAGGGENFMDTLNPQQMEAVRCRSRIIYVNAGPGTGKTHLLTSRLIEYIRSSERPQKIVSLSFTNTAADHIGETFEERVRHCRLRKEFTLYYGTIHSFCIMLLSEYKLSHGAENTGIILDDEELLDFAEEVDAQLEGRYGLQEIAAYVRSRQKSDNPELAALVGRIKDRYRVMSVEDILTTFINAADSDLQFRSWLSGRLTVMAVDEAQDLSEPTFGILDRLLSAIPEMKLFLVGDPRQNIFGFNGGSYRHLEAFLGRHVDCTTLELSCTYRFGQVIADYVNRFRFSDCDNLQMHSFAGQQGEVNVQGTGDERMEALAVIQELNKIGNLSESAVLCNNLSYLCPFLQELQQRKIPYKVYGGRRLLKPHVRLLKHLLRIIDSRNEYSIRLVARQSHIDISHHLGDGKTCAEVFFETEPGKLLKELRGEYRSGKSGLYGLMLGLLTKVMRMPEEGSDLARDYGRILEMSADYASVSDFLWDFATDRDKFAEFYQKEFPDSVETEDGLFLTVSTIHSAKGLEWDNVFIMGLSEGNFPNPYFCRDMPIDKQNDFFNDETKKMYVASTRARKRLFLTYSRIQTRKGHSFHRVPSRFISNYQS